MTAAVLPEDVRKARAFLQQRGVRTADISPQHFARSAKELGKGFAATLNYLALLLSGGSGNGQSETATASKDRLDPQRALGQQTPSQAMKYDSAQGEDA